MKYEKEYEEYKVECLRKGIEPACFLYWLDEGGLIEWEHGMKK